MEHKTVPLLSLSSATLLNLNFHPLEVVFRYSDPQRQVGQNYLHMLCTDLNKRHAKIANLLLFFFLNCLVCCPF